MISGPNLKELTVHGEGSCSVLSAEMKEQEVNRDETLSQARVSRRASWKKSFPESSLIIPLPD